MPEGVDVQDFLLNSNTDKWELIQVLDIHHGTRVERMAWSPKTDDNNICLCTIGAADKKLRYFQLATRLDNNVSENTILGTHSDYINGCAFNLSDQSNFSPGTVLASVSDDHKCSIWNIETRQEMATLYLKSPGMAVSWHQSVADQLMVAEQLGSIKIYDVRSGAVVNSLQTKEVPLQDAHWSPSDESQIGVVAGLSWYIWTVNQGVRPSVLQALAHMDGVSTFRWSLTNPNFFACSGHQSRVSVWDKTHPSAPHTYKLQSSRIQGLSWLQYANCLVTGSDHSILFWLV